MKNALAYFFAITFVIGTVNAQTKNLPKDAALESLGSISGLLTYQTYLTIGAIADGYANDAYNAETVTTLMDEQMGSCKRVSDQFQKLYDSGFLTNPDDKKFVKDFIATMGLLSKEAEALKKYVNDKSEANNSVYRLYRDQAWNALSSLLGIE